MLRENDYVNYSTHGICRIEGIRPVKFGGDDHENNYYILKPLDQGADCIFIPADNHQLVDRMRPILSPGEIDSIILSVKNQHPKWIDDRKERKARFQEILSRRDERELLLLILCLYFRAKENPKGISASEAAVLKKAETVIEQEFSFSLKISKQKTGSYIRTKLGLPEPANA